MTTSIDDRKLRMAMIGGGPGSGIGRVHRMAASLDGEIELVAGAFSGDPGKSEAQGRALRLPPSRVYGSWEEMLRREAALSPDERPDLVSIVTPNHLHFRQAMAAIASGFHVVMDKPMTMNLAEALELRDMVRKSGRVLALTHPFAANSMIKLARDLIGKGVLGKLRKITVDYPQGWLSRPVEKKGNKQASWRTDPALAGTGCLADIGTHAANLAEAVSGLRLIRVAADVAAVVDGRLTDDDFTVLARWEGGVRGSIQASQIAAGEYNDLGVRVYGELAGLVWRHAEMNYLSVRYQDRPWEKWTRGAPYVAEASPAAGRLSRFTNPNSESYFEEFANIYCNVAGTIRAVEAGRSPGDLELDFATVDDGVRGMAFIEAALESSRRDSTWVDVGTY